MRVAGLLQQCAPKSGPLFFNAASRDGTKLLSFWLNEIEPLAWVVYEPGNFQLVVPGSSGARESIADLALIEIANQAEPGRWV
ncbi:MAG: hypothetical protein IPJ19_13795 [Planctomycetes bacterium]|nr:hypothetical protein [Planctomycetota bacterium]